MIIKGKIVSGLQKGHLFVSQYNPEFQKWLGFSSYPGTLNIKVKDVLLFPLQNKIQIKPPEGGIVDCYLTIINNVLKGAIVIPHKTRHPREIIEIIAPANIREMLHLKDGDEIQCELE
ncbi:CTP-dependent riboflavin kinase [Candidatus Woesearchaeota archaeon]|nr:CTP-dependent riboflavin kinase [Candidatus Woesearchaeota archaeon]